MSHQSSRPNTVIWWMSRVSYSCPTRRIICRLLRAGNASRNDIDLSTCKFLTDYRNLPFSSFSVACTKSCLRLSYLLSTRESGLVAESVGGGLDDSSTRDNCISRCRLCETAECHCAESSCCKCMHACFYMAYSCAGPIPIDLCYLLLAFLIWTELHINSRVVDSRRIYRGLSRKVNFLFLKNDYDMGRRLKQNESRT
jgi:hypothetical protein